MILTTTCHYRHYEKPTTLSLLPHKQGHLQVGFASKLTALSS